MPDNKIIKGRKTLNLEKVSSLLKNKYDEYLFRCDVEYFRSSNFG